MGDDGGDEVWKVRRMIIFLGAGASRAFGIPTMPEFIALFDETFEDSNLYKSVKNALGSSIDLESLLTVLHDLSKPLDEIMRTIAPHTFMVYRSNSQGESLISSSEIKLEATQLLSSAKQIIRKKCLQAVRDQKNEIVDGFDALFNRINRLGGNVKSGDGVLSIPSAFHIFTTNYDTCLEQWANVRQIEVNRGIRQRFNENVFSVGFFGDAPVRLYKLHGSVDMFVKDGQIRQFNAFANSEGIVTSLGQDLGEEYMFYPIESSGYDHALTAPFLGMMSQFRQSIDQDGLWLLIGTSLRDRTIASTLDDVLRTKSKGNQARMAVLDPKVRYLKERLEAEGLASLAGALHPIESRFPEAIGLDEVSRYFMNG